MKTKNSSLTPYSKRLRKDMTPEERKLWFLFLRRLNVTINRQKVFGYFILDFYCASAMLAIEIDGSQHFEDKEKEYDKQRDAYLQSMGITVLRFTNRDINLLFDEVCDRITTELSKRISVSLKDSQPD